MDKGGLNPPGGRDRGGGGRGSNEEVGDVLLEFAIEAWKDLPVLDIYNGKSACGVGVGISLALGSDTQPLGLTLLGLR